MNTQRRNPGSWLLALVIAMVVSRAQAWPEELYLGPDVSAEDILDTFLAVPPELDKTSAWLAQLDLRQGAGYGQNVLYTPFVGQDSMFSVSEAELLAYLPLGSAHRLSIYAFGNHRHYVDLPANNVEYNALAQGEWEYQFNKKGACGLDANYQFFDQFFDASISEVELDSTRLKQQDVGASTFARYAVLPYLTARVQGGYKVAVIDQSDDDYRECEVSSSLQGQSQSGSTLALTYGYTRDDYDHREMRTGVGEVVPDETVDIASHLFRLHGSWYWDAARNWMMRWGGSQRLRDDTGGGYYDYESWQGTMGIRVRMGQWSTDLRAGYTDTQYDRQPSDILDPASEPLHKQRADLELRVERTLGKRWSLFTEITWEDNRANDPLGVYEHFTGAVGLGYNLIATAAP
jgi:hypothetical protein